MHSRQGNADVVVHHFDCLHRVNCCRDVTADDDLAREHFPGHVIPVFPHGLLHLAVSGHLQPHPIAHDVPQILSHPLHAVHHFSRQTLAAQRVVESNTPNRPRDVIFVPTREPIAEAMMNLANVTADDVVYDLGCGDGRNTLFLAHKGLHVTAVDIVPEAIANLKGYAARAKLQTQVDAVVADIEGYGIEGPYENIVSVFTLHFLPAKAFPVVLNRIMEATAVGGINVIEDFTQNGPLCTPDVEGHFLQSGELKLLYEEQGWHILHYAEGTATTRATDRQGNRIKQGSATIVSRRS